VKVIHAVGWYLPDSLGGTEVYVAAIARLMKEAGHTVAVAAPERGREGRRRYDEQGVAVFRYGIPAALSRAECQGLKPVRGVDLLHGWLASERADVVNVHTLTTGLGLRELEHAKQLGAAVIVTSHLGSHGWLCQRGTLLQWGEKPCDGHAATNKCAPCMLQMRGLPRPVAAIVGGIPPSIGRAFARIHGKAGTALGMSDLIRRNLDNQARMVALVDALVVLSRAAYDVVIANGAPNDKVALNRLGSSIPRGSFKPSPEEQPTKPPVKIGYAGRFEPIKGALDLARAVASLPRDFPIRVEFRGPVKDERDRGTVAEIRRLLGDDPRVTIEPAAPSAGMDRILRGYDVLCCPSTCFENGPTVAIEAQAVGTPVIGTRMGGMPELIEDGVNGVLVTPGDWRSLADVLRRVGSEPAATIDTWRRALRPGRTMHQVAADYLELYRRCSAR